MKLLTNSANLSVTLSTDPPAVFRKLPLSLEPIFTVMKIVSVLPPMTVLLYKSFRKLKSRIPRQPMRNLPLKY
jgi:hypothetical protein